MRATKADYLADHVQTLLMRLAVVVEVGELAKVQAEVAAVNRSLRDVGKTPIVSADWCWLREQETVSGG